MAYIGDITRDTIATVYGIRHDRAIKISPEGVPTYSRSLTPTLVIGFVSSEDSCPGSSARCARTRDTHVHTYARILTHTRHARTSHGELSGAQASIYATNHDHPMRYRDRWRVYSLMPTHCAEIKFYNRNEEHVPQIVAYM